MWFTAGDGWDPANFWADCFEKTLCFSVEIVVSFPKQKLGKDPNSVRHGFKVTAT